MDETTLLELTAIKDEVSQLRADATRLTLLKGIKDKGRTAQQDVEVNNLTNAINDTLPDLLPKMVRYYLDDFAMDSDWEHRINGWDTVLKNEDVTPPSIGSDIVGLEMLNELFTKVQNALITLDGVALDIAMYWEAYQKCYERFEAIVKMAVPDLKVDSSDALAKGALTDEVISVETSLTVMSKLFSTRKQTLLSVKQTLSEIAQNQRLAVPYPSGLDSILNRPDRKQS